jgi:hypothetical protein
MPRESFSVSKHIAPGVRIGVGTSVQAKPDNWVKGLLVVGFVFLVLGFVVFPPLSLVALAAFVASIVRGRKLTKRLRAKVTAELLEDEMRRRADMLKEAGSA